MVDIHAVARRATKAAKLSLVSSICSELDRARKTPNDRIPHGMITRLLNDTAKVAPEYTITRHDIRYHLKVRKKTTTSVPSSESAVVPSPFENVVVPSPSESVVVQSRANGGRPKGATKVLSEINKSSYVEARNEIVERFAKEKRKAKSEGRRLKRGRLDEIIELTRKKLKLPNDFSVSRHLIRWRTNNASDLVVKSGKGSGQKSPLLEVEDQFVSIVIQMARIGDPLTPMKALALFNDLIAGTSVQEKLKNFKLKHTQVRDDCKLGEVGYKYWRNFKTRNSDKIVTRKGEKYEMNRSNWTTYHNFAQMYRRFGEEMEYAKVAEKLAEAVWMNREGEKVDEDDAFGCKVSHIISRPDMILCMDEVGSNTCQKGDGNVGGEKFICPVEYTPREICSTTDKHWTLLGLTAFDGTPVMCIVIIQGTKKSPLNMTGLDLFAEIDGSVTDSDFFEKNSGPGKMYPGGPKCKYKGKTVPCMVRFTPKASIDGEILLEIIGTLDELGFYDDDRSKGIKPMLLIDAHGSRFDLNFLTYINNAETEWSVCIGVPYGTALWQVGDSSEQNGAYKIACSKFKRDLFKKKRERKMSPQIFPYEIMLVINYAWEKSFGRVKYNKRAICERGWFPYNRNILTYPKLRSTMTDDDRTAEYEAGLVPYITATTSTPIATPATPSTSIVPYNNTVKLNFDKGMAAYCLDALVSEADRAAAVQRNC